MGCLSCEVLQIMLWWAPVILLPLSDNPSIDETTRLNVQLCYRCLSLTAPAKVMQSVLSACCSLGFTISVLVAVQKEIGKRKRKKNSVSNKCLRIDLTRLCSSSSICVYDT